MDVIEIDIAIVGAGGAGLRAAIAAAEADSSLTLALISKVYPMRSHTVAAEGGAAGVIKDNDSLDNHFNDTVSGGDWLCDQDAVELFVNTAPLELLQLEHWGCPWSRETNGKVAVRPFGGMKIERTWYAADKTGFHILHTLFQTSLKYPSIKRFDEYYSTDLIVEDGRCTGVIAIEMRSGRMVAFRAKAVVIATGGAGRIFPFTTNGAIKTGDGMAMAYRAGVPLKDMEFIQYHPTGLPGTGILITEGSRGEGGILVNKDGYRYLQDYNLGPPDPWPRKKAMELGPRDRLSQAFWHEQRKGRTIKTSQGDVVYLDIRQLGEKKINERLPMVRELAQAYVGVDPVHAMIPVRPVVHYTMGGIHTDINTATSLPGLFAAGECACVSINGANRLGSNSLAEIVVFGARAGREATAFAEANPKSGAGGKAGVAAQERLRELFGREGGTDTVSGLRKAMNDTMETGAGIYRSEDTLQKTCSILADLRARYRKIQLQDRSNVFNTDLIQTIELGCMLDVASAMAHSALQRKESRGSHQRLEYPGRDDVDYLKHSLASYRGDEPPSIDYCDVVITKSQPAERVYGGSCDMSETIALEVLRYNPETANEPSFQSYTVPYKDEWVVLDALNHIKDNLDATLSYRWSCHMAVCGSCGMTINNEPKLSCHTFLRDYRGGVIRVEPLDHFPIERDLVIVMDSFMDKLSSVKPYLIPKEDKPLSAGEYLQSPGELQAFHQYTQCINCMLCYAACPQVGLNEDFVGPAALALAHRYNLDSRDAGRNARAEVVASNEGIWECTFVGACSQVCPKSVDPAAAIQQTKISASVDWLKDLLTPRAHR